MRTTKLSIYLMSLRFCTCFQYCFARKICKISRALLQISSHLAYQATETTGYFRFTSPSLKHAFLLKVNFFTDTDSLPTRTPGGLVIAVAADAQVRGRPVSVAHGAVEGSLLPLPRRRRRRPVHQERDDGDVGAADEVVGLRRAQARLVQGLAHSNCMFCPLEMCLLHFRPNSCQLLMPILSDQNGLLLMLMPQSVVTTDEATIANLIKHVRGV